MSDDLTHTDTKKLSGNRKGYEIETKTKKIHIETMVMKKYFKVLLLEDK